MEQGKGEEREEEWVEAGFYKWLGPILILLSVNLRVDRGGNNRKHAGFIHILRSVD